VRAVIPVGRGRPPCLPYVARSLAKHASITELVTVGERPTTLEPDLHLDSPNAGKPYQNVAGHLRLAAELGGEFIWCDDDTFLMKPWTPGVYVRPFSIAHMLRENPNVGGWSVAVRNSITVMKEWGYDPEQVPCGPVHKPWLVESSRVIKTLDGLDTVGGGSFKALYVAGLEGVIETDDVKIVNARGLPSPKADVVSVHPHSWAKNTGNAIRQAFPERSRWESEPPTENADNRRGPQRHKNRRR
jgi:hypothetical protein